VRFSGKLGVRGAAAMLMATGLLVVAAAPVAAATKGPQTTDVSCDGVTIKSGVSVSHVRTGTLSIKQNSTSPTSSTKTWAVSANGNSLSTKTVSNGGTASWTSVLPSTYTVRAFRSTNANCNGILPGAGNYSWNYTVTYQG
jgi:hypothetical protein